MARNYAICIGINDYKERLMPLEYAQNDAEAMRDFCLKEAKFEEVYFFAKDAPQIQSDYGPAFQSEPTFTNLKYFFRKRFTEPFLDVGDNVWFFFAGHGELHNGHDYLMPADVDPDNLEDTALRISDITAYLRNSGADNTVLLLDACRNNQGRRSTMGFGSDEQQGIVTIYSCGPRQSSYEIEKLQHGTFTYALLEGFQLQGASSRATVERIDRYLQRRVPELNKQYKKPIQTPYTAVEPISKNCLILLPKCARLQDLQALKIAAYKAEQEDENYAFAHQLWVRCLAASENTDQDAIAAIGRIAIKQASQTQVPKKEVEQDIEPLKPEISEDNLPQSEPQPIPEQHQAEASPQKSPDALYELPTSHSHETHLAEYKNNMKLIQEEPSVSMAPYLVSNYLFEYFIQENPDWAPDKQRENNPSYLEHWEDNFPNSSQKRLPVTNVSFEAIQAFVKWLSAKTQKNVNIPTLRQWELASMIEDINPMIEDINPMIEGINTASSLWINTKQFGGVNYANTSRQLREIDASQKNEKGIRDLFGNAYDVCIEREGAANVFLAGGSYSSTSAQLLEVLDIKPEKVCKRSDISFRFVIY